MKKPQCSPEQVAFDLRRAEEGTPMAEVCRKMSISEQTLYRWKKRFQGRGLAEVRRLRVLIDFRGSGHGLPRYRENKGAGGETMRSRPVGSPEGPGALRTQSLGPKARSTSARSMEGSMRGAAGLPFHEA